MWVTLEQESGGRYIVSDDLFAVYGDGDTLVEALRDYEVSLIDYYEILHIHTEDDLPTRALFGRLCNYLRLNV